MFKAVKPGTRRCTIFGARFTIMTAHLDNPIWSALTSDCKPLGNGTQVAKCFLPDVAPFGAVQEDTFENFQALYDLCAAEQVVVLFSPKDQLDPAPWTMINQVPGIQMVFEGAIVPSALENRTVPLRENDVPQMLALTSLTQPGPFLPRTIEFGGYYGIFEGEMLVAMGGERLQGDLSTEISAVCTHPDHAGRGFANAILTRVIENIKQKGRLPYLHVRADNTNAIALYRKMGFVQRSVMNFYILKR